MITQANARELQQRGVANRLARKFTVLPQSKKPVNAMEFTQTFTPLLQERAAHVLAIVDKLVILMDRAGDDDRKLDNYSRAYDRVFKAWMVLSGTPGSGQRKPPPLRTQRTLDVLPEPIQLVQANPVPPVPVQPSTWPACGVEATPGGVPAPDPVPVPPQQGVNPS